jgi:hypothetical protein
MSRLTCSDCPSRLSVKPRLSWLFCRGCLVPSYPCCHVLVILSCPVQADLSHLTCQTDLSRLICLILPLADVQMWLSCHIILFQLSYPSCPPLDVNFLPSCPLFPVGLYYPNCPLSLHCPSELILAVMF